ncbi:hypothetical protein TgHK011_006791 [Trichoderma gracile]|nr:hypothetical protein TgHK011_006791 [Trichoderma gracile]
MPEGRVMATEHRPVTAFQLVSYSRIQQLHRLAISIFRGKPGPASSSPDRKGPLQIMSSPDSRQRMDMTATVGER